MRSIAINGEDYDISTRQGGMIVNSLMYAWEKLGKPDTPLSESGQKLMTVIIATWEDTYPDESKRWYAMRQDYQENEMSIKQQVKQNTGRSLASYPSYIYMIMKRMFPKFKLGKRENVLKLIKRYPMFRMANKV